MFKWGKRSKTTIVAACTEGTLIPLKDVKDQVFSSGAIGRGVAIKPTSSKVAAPVGGIVKMIFPTNHAIAIETKEGLEILIHIGIDTVKLKGEGFKRIAYEGQEVKVGDVLVEVDFDVIKEKGYSTDILIILTTESTKADFEEVENYGSQVAAKESVIFTCNMKQA